MKITRRKRPISERFWEKVNKAPGLGPKGTCWEWKSKTAGYGMFWLNERMVGAHVVAWLLSHGEIPKGKFILHKCDNKKCVRHLFIGTPKDNAQDAKAKRRFSAQRRTHCPQKHPYSPKNTYINTLGHRFCRLCNRDRTRRVRNG